MTHALLSPSAAHMWVRCPGAVALAETMPPVDDSTPWAEEGTKAHEQAELAATALMHREDYKPTADDADMAMHAKGWAETINRLCPIDSTIFWSAERSLDISGIVCIPEARGTADFVHISTEGLLTIADFKYGMGVEVSAERNLQLSIYAMAAMDEFSLIEDIKGVRLVIYQPRITPIAKTYEWDIGELEELRRHLRSCAKTALDLVGTDAENLAASLRPGEAQCRFCRAKGICPALRKQAQALTALDFEVVDAAKAPAVPTAPEVIARALPWLDTIESWCDAVRSTALGLLQSGTPVPGYKLVAGRKGARKWADGAEDALKRMAIARDAIYEKKLRTPTALEKEMKAGRIGTRQWKRLEALMVQAEGKPAVAPESDKRPALQITNVKDEFDQLV